MRWFRCGSVLAAAALAAGCLQSSTVIKVTADGSGTIEQQMLVSGTALTMMAGMGAENRGFDEMFDEKSMKETAAKLGKGVRLVSREPVEVNGMKGARAVFAFDDVNALSVSQSPDLPGMGGGEGGAENVAFRLERRGSGRVLTITMPKPEAGEAEAPEEAPEDVPEDEPDQGRPDDEVPPEAVGMMKMMFRGLKVYVAVEVDGEITKSNAKYRDGSRVTLAEVDFDQLMGDEESFKVIQGRMRPGGSAAELQKVMANLKGVKVNDEPVVRIEWQ